MRRGFVLGAVLLFACGGSGGVFGSSVAGTVAADITTADVEASWQITPNRCYSGERAQFFGVDLTEDDDEDTLVRIAQDPVEGYRVGTNVPGEDLAVFVQASDECATFDVDVVRTNTRVNDIWDVQGHAVVDCELPGLSLHIDVNFSGCH